MKKILTTIILSFGILFGLASVSSASLLDCAIDSVKFGEIGGIGNTGGDNNFNGTSTTLTINVNQEKPCVGGIDIKLKKFEESGQTSYSRIDGNLAIIYPNVDNAVEIEFELGEDVCFTPNGEEDQWGYKCISFVEIYSNNQLVFSGQNNPNLNKEYVRTTENADDILRDSGILIGNCSFKVGTPVQYCEEGDPYENDINNWEFSELTKGDTPSASNCVITKDDIHFSNIERILNNRSPILTIDTNGCIDVPITISLKMWNVGVDPQIDIKRGEDSSNNLTVIPIADQIVLYFNKSTERGCQKEVDPDCNVYVDIGYGNKTITNYEYVEEYEDNWETNFDYLSKGLIFSDCEDGGLGIDCSGGDPWEIFKTSGIKDTGIDGDPININILDLEEYFDPQSPCYVKPGGELGPSGKTAGDKGGYKEDCYELLAPIPGIGTDGGNGRFSIDFSSYQIGQYIQSLFNVALGMLMLLSVIMIIVAGVEYMTVESIFGKSRAKGRITGAMTGLILGLGIFIILRTINPQLLEINFGSNVETKTIGFQLAEHSGAGIKPASGADVPESARDTNSRDKRAIKPEWAIVNGKVLQLTGDEGIKEVRACDEDNMEKVTAFGKSFYVNKYVKESLLKVNAKWEASKGTNDFYEVPGSKSDADAMGSYVCRKTSQGGISYHSYGLSVDINPTKNPQGSVLKTDMPESFINFWKEEGWGWGGDWSSSKDAMHFSKIKSEGGDQKY